MLIGMIRTKVMALLIGPVGMGIFGMYDSIIVTAGTVTGMGVGRSGVREVALTSGNGDKESTAKMATSLKRIALLLGIVGMVIMVCLSSLISRITFGNTKHSFAVMLLSSTLIGFTVGGAYIAIMQGVGRVSDLAKFNISSSALGSAAAIALFVVLGHKGVLPAIISIYAAFLAVAIWFGRKIDLPRAKPSWTESLNMSPRLLKLGLALMNAAVIASVVAYTTRVLIGRNLGIEAVGIYICGFSLSGKFVNFIIEAIWKDFYPRASSVANDHSTLNRLVNEQIEISLLLAVPGLFATIILAPWLVRLFYSKSFEGAVLLIRWFTLGCLGGVISRPIQIIQIAKGRSLIFFFTETLCSTFHVLMIVILIRAWSLPGAAIAYVLHNFVQIFVSMVVAKRLTGFSWSLETARMIGVFALLSVFGVVVAMVVGVWKITIIGTLGTIVLALYCLRQLTGRLGPDHRLSIFASNQPIIGRLFVNH